MDNIIPKTRKSEQFEIRDSCVYCGSKERGEPFKTTGGQWELCINCGTFYQDTVGLYGYLTELRNLGVDIILQRSYDVGEPKIARVLSGEPDTERNGRLDHAAKCTKMKDSILELGFGGGENIDYALKSGWRRVVGIEVMPDFILFVRSKGHEAHRVDVSVQPKIKFMHSCSDDFNLVFATEVIEHVPSPCEFLMGASEYLLPDGMLWVSFASANFLHDSGDKLDPGYLDEWQWATKKGIELLIMRCGLEIVEIEEFRHYFLVAMKKKNV